MQETEEFAPLIIIHALPPADAGVLREMLYHAIYVPEGHPRPTREILAHPDLAKYFEHWGQDGDTAVAAFDADSATIIGTAWFRLFSADRPGYGFVNAATPELTVAVLPAYRGRDIGSRLLARLLDKAQRRFAAISLSVDPRNRAMRLYRRLGFEAVRENDDSVTMVKRFAGETS